MRGKRSKQYRKLMHQYALHFGFREPYQVLLDAEILRDAARFKMNFIVGLEKALHGQVKPMITQCSMRHLYASEPRDSEILEHAKAFERRRCNHHTLEQPLSSLECLTSVVDPKASKTNKNRYAVASQDEKVRAYMRTVPGVPMIYLKRSVMIMEPMAAATERVTEKEERSKFRLGLRAQKNPGKRGREDGDEDEMEKSSTTQENGETEPPKKKRKRGPSGPNPLSVKKAKKEPVQRSDRPKAQQTTATDITPGVEPVRANTVGAAPLDEVAMHKRKRRHKSSKDNNKDVTTETPSLPAQADDT